MRHLLVIALLAGCSGSDGVSIQRTTLTNTPVPNVMIVMDTSQAMASPTVPGLGGRLFDDVRLAMHRMLEAHGNAANFGLAMLPGDGACGEGTLLLPITPDADSDDERLQARAAQVDGWIQALPLGGSAPIAYTFGMLANHPENFRAFDRQQYVLLVTASEPECGGSEVSGVAAMARLGVQTVVVGYGREAARSTVLNRMSSITDSRRCHGGTDAECGASGRCVVDTRRCELSLWAAPDRAALDDVFETMFGFSDRWNCGRALHAEPATAERVTVLVDGVQIEPGAATWELRAGAEGGTQVQFLGATCRKLRAATVAKPVELELRVDLRP